MNEASVSKIVRVCVRNSEISIGGSGIVECSVWIPYFPTAHTATVAHLNLSKY